MGDRGSDYRVDDRVSMGINRTWDAPLGAAALNEIAGTMLRDLAKRLP
jgi:hypothetical protein